METPPRRISPRATLNEIAEQAGVSVTTVSLVLSKKASLRRISSRVISKVEEVAAKLDYSPNLLVQSLQAGRTNVLSFYNGFHIRSKNDLYMDRLFTEIQIAAGERGYDILFNCDFTPSVEDTYSKLNGGRADGLLFFAPRPDDPLLDLLRVSRLPVLLINTEDPDGKLPSVQDDVKQGMRLVVDQLLSLGHRRFGALGNVPAGNKDAAARVSALQMNLKDHGLYIDDRHIVETDDMIASDAEVGLKRMLSSENPPTAIFCWHDRLGYQILDCCERLGISVPDDLSVVGYDGLRWSAATHHELASVAVDLRALAQESIESLHNMILHKTVDKIKALLPVTLTPGTTLGPAPSQFLR